MLQSLSLITMGLVALGAFAAVVRDVPILNVFGLPRRLEGRRVSAVVCLAFLASFALDWFGVTVGGASPVAYVWPLVLDYVGWCVVWNLRHRAQWGEDA